MSRTSWTVGWKREHKATADQRSQSRASVERALIVSASVGGGHDQAAAELRRRLEACGLVVECRDYLDSLPRVLRYLVRGGYVATVLHVPRFYDWLYGALERWRLVRGIALLLPRWSQRRVRRWAAGQDVVVSTYPLASQCLGLLAASNRLHAPTLTYLTDPSVHTLWISRHVGRHLTVLPATAQLAERRYGIPMTVAGPLVAERFSAPLSPERRHDLRRELGLVDTSPVVLLTVGSLGLGNPEEAAQLLSRSGLVTPLVLCGRNKELYDRLSTLEGVVALGWRDDVHELLQIADVLVHNAGGMAFTESLVARVPAVTYDCIPGHGRANGEVLADCGIAPLVDDARGLVPLVLAQLAPAALARSATHLPALAQDAADHVIADLRAAAAQPRRARVASRMGGWRIVVAGVAALLTVFLGATQGVSAAAGHGIGVARLPNTDVAVLVPLERLDNITAAQMFALRASEATVMLPARMRADDLVTAGRLTAAGIGLVSENCADADLLRHGERCSVAPASRRRPGQNIRVAPILVMDKRVDAVDMMIAEHKRVDVVRPSHVVQSLASTGWTCTPGILRLQDQVGTAGPTLARLSQIAASCRSRGLRLGSLTALLRTS